MNYAIRILNSRTPCWISSHLDGDPPRTVVFKNAQVFKSEDDAEDRIMEVKRTHPLKTMSYEIIKITNK